MSVNYIVRVLAVEGKQLTCRVNATYHGEPIRPSRTLAFRFIWEPWECLCDGGTWQLPEGSVVMVDEARERGRRAPLTRVLEGKDLREDDWSRAIADQFIFCVGVTNRLNYPDPALELYLDSALSQAAFNISVTDPVWLEHLEPGMEWDTFGYDHDARLAIMPEWLTPTVLSLLRGIHAEAAVDRLPILADALEEAGCDALDILNHCRGEGEHVRGCWVVHLLEEAIRRLG